MPTSVKEMMAAANAAIPKISPAQAQKLMREKNALVVDVRDPAEVEASGKVKGAINIPRGMLEFRADDETQHFDKSFSKDRPVIVYCASGGRSALSGKTLRDMGYTEVHNLGGFKDWAESGGEVEK